MEETKMISRGVYALIDSIINYDIFENRAPDNIAAPYVVYNRIREDRWRHVKGPSGMAQDGYQIDVYAENSNFADEIAQTIENGIDGYKGTVYYGDDSPQSYIRIGGISMQAGFSMLDQTAEPFLHRVSRDYLITYERS